MTTLLIYFINDIININELILSYLLYTLINLT